MEKILVIENDNILRANLKELLELNNFSVIEADKGETALRKIKNSSPDLVISNLFLPGMSGVKIQKNILQNEENCQTPFLFLSTINPNDFSHHLSSKVESLLIKPFENKELLDRINSILARKKSFSKEIEQINHSKMHTNDEIKENLDKIISITDSMSLRYDEYTKEELVGLLSSIKFSGIKIKEDIGNYLMSSDIECYNNCRNKRSFPILQERIKEVLSEISNNYGRNKDLFINISESTSAIPLSFFEFTLRELTKTAFRFSKRGIPIEVFVKNSRNKFAFGIKDAEDSFISKMNDNNFLDIQPFSKIREITKSLGGEFCLKGNKMFCSFKND
jgi:two-component system, sensor histidine kinase and response regulator